VVERGEPARGATWAAGGMLAPVSEAEDEPPELIELGSDSLGRFPAFVAELERETGVDCGYRGDGTLWVAAHRDDAEELDRLAEVLEDKRLEVRRLDAEAVARREPRLSGRILGGLEVPADHQVDPRRLAQALVRSVRARGRLVTGAAVRAVRPRDASGFETVLERRDGAVDTLASDEVVLAAGAWSFREIELPVEDPGLRPVKGQLVRLAGQELIRRVVRTPDVYLVPRGGGELLVGATVEEMGFDDSPTAGAVLDLLRHAFEVLPGIYDLAWIEVSVGLRPAVDDHLPVVGPTDVPGLYLAIGHFRNGILLAPATAHHLARCILEAQVPSELLPFRGRGRGRAALGLGPARARARGRRRGRGRGAGRLRWRRPSMPTRSRSPASSCARACCSGPRAIRAGACCSMRSRPRAPAW
jgi:glycine oxidase